MSTSAARLGADSAGAADWPGERQTGWEPRTPLAMGPRPGDGSRVPVGRRLPAQRSLLSGSVNHLVRTDMLISRPL